MKELGITTTNCYPKSSFLKDNIVFIGCFKSELEEDFYFYNTYDQKIYHLPKTPTEGLEKDVFNNKTKYLVPISKAIEIWEDRPYEELPDLAYSKMTLRHYACIKLGVPDSGIAWLDQLIKKSRKGRAAKEAYWLSQQD